MSNKKIQNAGGINWKVRLTNPQFLIRAAISVFLPALAFLGINWELAFTSWAGAGEAIMMILGSPIAIGIILVNLLNLAPDPTKSGFTDSQLVLDRKSPKDNSDTQKYKAPEGYVYPKEETPDATMQEQMDEYEAMQAEKAKEEFEDIEFKK